MAQAALEGVPANPAFFVAFLGLCQIFRTINKFNAPQPVDWSEGLAREIEAREAAAAVERGLASVDSNAA